MCPCGSGRVLSNCCGRFLDDHQRPDTAEALMRSRYTAYVLGRVLYLRESWHPRTRPRELMLEAGVTWRGLTVLSARSRDAEHAIVEFIARYTQAGGEHALHETSLFERRRGAWVYVAPVDAA